jgi:arsenite-transporting ATPase
LVVSTDPAHSLGDALQVRLSSRPKTLRLSRAKRGGALSAVELDAQRAFARWLTENGPALGDIVEHGTWLDRDDVDALMGLSVPGIDELVGMLEIVRLAMPRSGSAARKGAKSPRNPRNRRSSRTLTGSYDLVVVDTAPTGHTLRLLAAPEAVGAIASVLDALQQEHRFIREQLARVGRPEAADRLIATLAAQARETAALLRDPGRTTFEWVTLPEELSLAESVDAIAALDGAGISISRILVNRVLPDGPPCRVCDRRRADERSVLAKIRRGLGKTRVVHVVPGEVDEPRGVAALGRIGRIASSGRTSHERRARGGSHNVRRTGDAIGPARHAVPESLDALRGARLIFFGGKGGVGKTTVAAASAIRLARADAARDVLLLSTDPAHSLGDVFDQPIGDRPTAVRGGPPNLRVRELNAGAAFASRRAALEAAVEEIGAAIGADGVGSARSISELMDLAPPGIDELFGLLSVAELLTGSVRESLRPSARSLGRGHAAPHPLIVIDTAPTGHALRLLELPDAAHEWVQQLLHVLLKYRSLVRPGRLAAELVDVSKSIRTLQTLLQDKRYTRFIVVTRAAEVPRAETDRLLDRLARLRLATPAVIVNAMTLDPGTCRRCLATAIAERRTLVAIGRRCRRRARECAIIQAPLVAPPPRGVSALDRWAQEWISDVPGAEGSGPAAQSR